ncbi:P-loop containing nucleoside triphosphate hydrolase protein [Aspergillus karnatakaensis]|uniref:putative ABC transporter n=1 Tax=Aspergillus karnatakaensis TaxID=1810916 RepID=UPI003CCDD5E4
MSDSAILLAASVAACTVALLFSGPHVYALVTDCRDEQAYQLLEHDGEDGTTTTAKSPRSLWQRVCLVLAAAVLASVASWLWIAGPHELRTVNILEAISSITILFQEIILASRRHAKTRYRLGIYSALASFATAVPIGVPIARTLYREQGVLAFSQQDALTIVQIVASVILLVVNLSIPRGPAAYRNGRIIDAEHSISFLNRYTFSWAYKTLSLAGKNGSLNPEDLPLVAQEVRAKALSDAFFSTDSTSVQWRKWVKLYWRSATVQVVIQLFANAVNFLPNVILLAILRLFEDRDAGASNQSQLWLTALGLGLSMIVVSWLVALRDYVGEMKISLPVNEQLFAVITKKAMGIKDIVHTTKSDGDESEDDEEDEDCDKDGPQTKHSILNLLGVDVEKISDLLSYCHLLLDSVIEISISAVFLVYLLGWKATIAGCAIPLLLIPLYYRVTKKYSIKEQSLMERRDEKSESLTEMVRGMRQIKFSALESEWYDKILQLRGKELQEQQAVFRYNIYITALWTFGPICMSFLSIVTHIYVKGSISPSTAFTALSLFENLQATLTNLPEVFTDLLDARVSLRRISRFLGLEDHVDDRVKGDEITFCDATISWSSSASDQTEERFELRDLNLSFPSRQLSIISGRSGAGKSLLLQMLIGEADVVEGSVIIPRADDAKDGLLPSGWLVDGMVAYVSQDPWIENATIRDAILFGLPFDQGRYEDVIHACALTPDLKIFPDGDKTDIGSNGINLSGGQKWRLALARALYSRARILIFDDIFSAVDSHVGRHLYENALTGKLAEGRTRILATHHVKMCLDGAAYLVKLDNGRVVQAKTLQGSANVDGIDTEDSTGTTNSRAPSPSRTTQTTRRESVSKAAKFYEEEKRETGFVKAMVYKRYMAASGGHLRWLTIGILFILAVFFYLGSPYWVSIWTRSYEDNTAPSLLDQPAMLGGPITPSGVSGIDDRLIYYGSVYLAISIGSWLLGMVRTLIILNGSIQASKVMFEQFATSILRSPLRFLDTTPVGQILNRFTSDFGTLDSDLALTAAYVMHGAVFILGIVVAALVTSPVIVGLGLVAFLASWVVARVYVTGARETKRLESTAKSPLFELVGSLLTGLPTVRAFGREEAYIQRMYDLIDTHCQALWHRRLFVAWMDFWLSMVGAVFVASVTMIFVVIRSLDAPLAGFALSFALELSNVISWLLSDYARLEVNFNAAERIVEYTNLEQEPQDGVQVPASWPTRGELEVTDLTVSYAPSLPPVLRNLNFTIQPGERVGIVGRTGAGKSSLAMTLLRCLDIRSGSIHIDGTDIASIRLHDLRSRVGMISQDPIVFEGTVRKVLDPFSQYDDSELRDALEKVGLSSPTQAQPNTFKPDQIEDPTSKQNTISLSFPIASSGKNLSQGQRQLLCLARALVSRPKILIMDEATASIDMESDTRIQRVLREEISVSGCTLLVIAHRLSTIADFDRVIVLDRGEVVENDTPKSLMGVDNGVFKGMVEGSGERGVVEGVIFGERK